MKNFNKEWLRLYAVTDRAWLGDETLYEQVEKALRGGATMVQIREKELDEAHFEEEAKLIQKLCRTYQVPLIINDNVALAKRIDADGVHIGQSDMEMKNARAILGEDKIIGVTAKTIEQAQAAEAAGADYLGSGAAFVTSTKTDAGAIDHKVLSDVAHSVRIPVVAIGGINKDNISQLEGLGLDGVAVVSAIFAADDISSAVIDLKAKAKKAAESSSK